MPKKQVVEEQEVEQEQTETGNGKVLVAIRMDKALRKQFQIACLMQDTNMNEVLASYAARYVEKHGK